LGGSGEIRGKTLKTWDREDAGKGSCVRNDTSQGSKKLIFGEEDFTQL
jgi:hypothetical protein